MQTTSSISLSLQQARFYEYLKETYGVRVAKRYKALVTHPSYLKRNYLWKGNSIKISKGGE